MAITYEWKTPLMPPSNLSATRINDNTGNLPAGTYQIRIVSLDSSQWNLINIDCKYPRISPHGEFTEVTIAEPKAPADIELSWTEPADATHYAIFFKESGESWGDTFKRSLSKNLSTGTSEIIDIDPDDRFIMGLNGCNTWQLPSDNFPASVCSSCGVGRVEITGSGTITLEEIETEVNDDTMCFYKGGQFVLMGSIDCTGLTDTSTLEHSSGSIWMFGNFWGDSHLSISFEDMSIFMPAYAQGWNTYENDTYDYCSFYEVGDIWEIQGEGNTLGEQIINNYGAEFTGSIIEVSTTDIYQNSGFEECVFTKGYKIIQPKYDMATWELEKLRLLYNAMVQVYDQTLYLKEFLFDSNDTSWDIRLVTLSASWEKITYFLNLTNERPNRSNNQPKVCWYSSNDIIEIGQREVHNLFTVDAHITDEDNNNLENATVTCIDKDDNEIFSVSTDINGNITQQEVTSSIMSNAEGGYTGNNTETNIDDKNPFTIIIELAGYETYKDKFNLYDKKEYDITIKKQIQLLTGTDGNQYLSLDPKNITSLRGVVHKI